MVVVKKMKFKIMKIKSLIYNEKPVTLIKTQHMIQAIIIKVMNVNNKLVNQEYKDTKMKILKMKFLIIF